MKARITSVLILAAALSATAFSPLSAASQKPGPNAFPVSRIAVASSGYEHIARGAVQGDVLRVMGTPFMELSPDVWVYRGYKADLDMANALGCDTMIITFANGKVADLKLVNQPAIAKLAANLKVKVTTGFYASAK